jgi:hypothetical protein
VTAQYHVRIRGRATGPFPLDVIRQLVRRGQVGRAHEVSLDGVSWRPAAEFPEIFAGGALAAAVPQVDHHLPPEAGPSPAREPEAPTTASQPTASTSPLPGIPRQPVGISVEEGIVVACLAAIALGVVLGVAQGVIGSRATTTVPGNALPETQTIDAAVQRPADDGSISNAVAEASVDRPQPAETAVKPPELKQEDPEALANKAFVKLQKDLDDNRHLPVEGLKPDDPDAFATLKFIAQSVRLCDVGSTEFDVELPTEAFQVVPLAAYRLRAEVAGDSNPGARAWAIRADLQPASSQDVSPDAVPQTVALGRVLHQDGSLRLELDAQAVQQSEMVAIAKIRQGLMTAALKIINRHDPGQTTWVQLCAPAANPRVVMEKFFFDKDLYPARPNQRPKRNVGKFDVPLAPWRHQFRLQATAAGAKGVVVDREPGAVVGQQDDASPSFTMRWSTEPGDEPFLETTFEIDTDISPRVLRLTKAELQDEWATHRRLRPIADAENEKFVFSGIKDKKDFEDDDLLKVRHSAIAALARSVASFHKDGFDKIQSKPNMLFSTEIGRDWVNDRLRLTGGTPPESCWRLALLRMLARTEGYKAWLSSEYPPPKQEPKPPSPKELEAWEKKRREKESQWQSLLVKKTDMVSAEDLPKFLTFFHHTKDAFRGERNKMPFPYSLEALICLLIEELEPLGREKQKALALIESLGDGTVSLEGDVVIGFPSAGATGVLSRFAHGSDWQHTGSLPRR